MKAIRQIAICGVGLIGASFGLAVRRCGYDGRIVGSSRAVSLAEAKRRGAIDDGFATAEEFIDKVGSASSMSCNPYLVQCADRPSEPSAQWLRSQLRVVRQAP